MTLKEAKIGSTVTVKKINGEGALKRRIMDMGITKGVSVYIRKVACCQTVQTGRPPASYTRSRCFRQRSRQTFPSRLCRLS